MTHTTTASIWGHWKMCCPDFESYKPGHADISLTSYCLVSVARNSMVFLSFLKFYLPWFSLPSSHSQYSIHNHLSFFLWSTQVPMTPCHLPQKLSLWLVSTITTDAPAHPIHSVAFYLVWQVRWTPSNLLFIVQPQWPFLDIDQRMTPFHSKPFSAHHLLRWFPTKICKALQGLGAPGLSRCVCYLLLSLPGS